MRVSVPASTANLGPGFDVLGLALAIPFELTDRATDASPGDRPWREAEPGHPATIAHRAAGGDGDLW